MTFSLVRLKKDNYQAIWRDPSSGKEHTVRIMAQSINPGSHPDYTGYVINEKGDAIRQVGMLKSDLSNLPQLSPEWPEGIILEFDTDIMKQLCDKRDGFSSVFVKRADHRWADVSKDAKPGSFHFSRDGITGMKCCMVIATPEQLRHLAPEVIATSTVPPGEELGQAEGGDA